MAIISFLIGIQFAFYKTKLSIVLITIISWLFTSKHLIVFFLMGSALLLLHEQLIYHDYQQNNIKGYIYKFSKNHHSFYFKTKNQQLLILSSKKLPTNHYLRLKIKLKKVANLKFASWLRQNHLQYGYLQHYEILGLRDLSLRERLALKLKKHDPANFAFLQALILGDKHNLDPKIQQLFRSTGTYHLLVISGAHIAFIYGIIFFIVAYFWQLSAKLCDFLPARRAASIFAIFISIVYAYLSGFGIPAQRALIFCMLLSAKYLGQKKLSSWHVCKLAAFIILLIEPHSALSAGFYLSFIAVAMLLIASKVKASNYLKKIMAIQLHCSIGLAPLSIYYFNYWAINGFLANLVAIPFVGFLMLPLAFTTYLHTSLIFSFCKSFLLSFLKLVELSSFVNINYHFHAYYQVVLLMFYLGITKFLPNFKIRLICLTAIIITL